MKNLQRKSMFFFSIESAIKVSHLLQGRGNQCQTSMRQKKGNWIKRRADFSPCPRKRIDFWAKEGEWQANAAVWLKFNWIIAVVIAVVVVVVRIHTVKSAQASVCVYVCDCICLTWNWESIYVPGDSEPGSAAAAGAAWFYATSKNGTGRGVSEWGLLGRNYAKQNRKLLSLNQNFYEK